MQNIVNNNYAMYTSQLVSLKEFEIFLSKETAINKSHSRYNYNIV